MYKLLVSNFLRIYLTYRKLLTLFNFSQSYLKNKKVDVFGDTVYTSSVPLFFPPWFLISDSVFIA